MELIKEQPKFIFDTSVIKAGYVLYAKHNSWKEGKAGFVTLATEKELVVQYHPGIGNVTNHFFIPIKEVAVGDWEIRWSSNLSEVFQYPTSEDVEQDPKEMKMENDIRGINL